MFDCFCLASSEASSRLHAVTLYHNVTLEKKNTWMCWMGYGFYTSFGALSKATSDFPKPHQHRKRSPQNELHQSPQEEPGSCLRSPKNVQNLPNKAFSKTKHGPKETPRSFAKNPGKPQETQPRPRLHRLRSTCCRRPQRPPDSGCPQVTT